MPQTPVDAVRKLTRAWMRKDAMQMRLWLTEDIIEIGPAFKNAMEGQPSFFRKYKAYLTGDMEILSYRILRPRTLRITNRAALVYFCYRMRTHSKGGFEDSEGKESMLILRRRGAWRVGFIHWHRDTPL